MRRFLAEKKPPPQNDDKFRVAADAAILSSSMVNMSIVCLSLPSPRHGSAAHCLLGEGGCPSVFVSPEPAEVTQGIRRTAGKKRTGLDRIELV